jgi:hypothetical protein
MKMHQARFFAQLDASSYYDQFELSESVANVFSFFCKRRSSWYRLRTLPMGFRGSCALAQLVSQVLIDVGVEGVSSASYIDNFFFWSDSRTALTEAIEKFRSRCAASGVVLNKDQMAGHIFNVDDDSLDTFDCLGEQYRGKTRTITETTRAKLQAAVEVLRQQDTETVSLKRVAAVFGIAFFAAGVFGFTNSSVGMARRFDSLFFYRQCSAAGQRDGWSKACPRMPPQVRQQTAEWLLDLLAHAPVPIVPPQHPSPQMVITFDACETGWGCHIADTSTGCSSFHAQAWTSAQLAQHNVAFSVVSEPLGCLMAVCRALSSGAPRHVLLRSDHQGLVFAARRGYAAARSYNDLIASLQQLFPLVTFSFEFVPGISNKADAFSRGLFGWGDDISVPTVRVG